MATVLCLPAQADIHEFSVMFTKSVKKKTKDWHDGYLKWHTFNYRAILYDEQRKQVANEFFPNRIIQSDSELEFGSAIVQIGDQLETLQANLEHVYRTSSKPSAIDVMKSTSIAAESITPHTPAVVRSAQKRIYPSTGMARIGRKMQTRETQATPIRPSAKRKLGLSRPTDLQSTTQNKQVAKTVTPRLDDRGAQHESGWLAREDRSVSLSEKCTEIPRKIKAKLPKKCNRLGKENQSSGPTHASQTIRNENKRRKLMHDMANSIPSAAMSSPVPAPGQIDDQIRESITLEVTAVEAARADARTSKFDPTRADNRPRPRKLLAAMRHRSGPAQVDASLELRDNLALDQMKTFDSTTDFSVSTDSCQQIACVEAILDIDSQKWFSENPGDSHGLSEVPEVIPSSQPASPFQASMRRHSTISDHTEVESVSTPENCTRQNSSRELNCLYSASASMPRKFPEVVSTPVVDDDGFLAPEIRKTTRKYLVPQCGPGKAKGRAVLALLEQFPEHPNTAEDEEQFFQLMAAREEPLFLPDASAEPQSESQEKGFGGLFTQIATRAAQQIASHSTVGRLGPMRRNKVSKLAPLHKKIGPGAIPANSKSMEPTRFAPEPAVANRSIIHSQACPLASGKAQLPSHGLHEELFPLTPIELQTSDLDAIFAADEGKLKSLPVSEAKTDSIPLPMKIKDHVGAQARLDTGLSAFRIATQINTRAPDFMSAKSFQQGASLQLDQPIAAVGLSAREIAAMDMSTQLSDVAET